METIEHKTITANGINIHFAEKGQGPLVLFLHGFPELWYTWRHQILFMAAHGYRAVAPDLRGYGDTTGAPLDDATKFTTLHVVGDIIALLDAIAPDEKQVFLVAHDWGALIAWHLCLYRPDRIKAHEPGDIEAEFAQIGVREVVKKILTYRHPGALYFPKGKGFESFPDVPVLPSWLSEEDVDYYTSKFEKNGFTGGINYYRALNLNWELTAPWTEAQVKVPTKFVVGGLDLVYNIPGAKEYIHGGGFKKYVPLLDEVVVMEGVAHFINQEKPDEINQHILDFFKKF